MYKALTYFFKLLFYFSLTIYIASFSQIHKAYRLNDLLSQSLYDKDNNLLAYNKNNKGNYYFKTDTKDVSELYLKMLIASEDKRFNYHIGVDPFAIVRAFYQNIHEHKIKSGASTIAMQTAKLLYKNKRSYKAKIKEAILASALTLYYGRDRVMSMYLSMLPFGSSINSTKAASYFLFKKAPNKLNTLESALLVAIPKHPRLISNIYKENKKRTLFYKNLVLKSAFINKVIDENTYKENLQKDIDIISCDVHDFKKCLYKQKAYYLGLHAFANTNEKEIVSFIDNKVQNTLIKHAEVLNKNNINKNLGIVVISHKNEIVGYVGGIMDEAFFVDISQSRRTSARSLDPFIYAYALNNNIINIKDLDLSSKVQNYKLQDLDSNKIKAYKSLGTTLNNSLNTEAKILLQKIKTKNFLSFINKDHKNVTCKDNSLALALGACSSRLIDLTNLYTIFNHDGNLNSLKIFYTKNNKIFLKTNRYTTKFTDKANIKSIKNLLMYKDKDISLHSSSAYNDQDVLSFAFNNNYTIGLRAIKIDDSPYSNEDKEYINNFLLLITSDLNKINKEIER